MIGRSVGVLAAALATGIAGIGDAADSPLAAQEQREELQLPSRAQARSAARAAPPVDDLSPPRPSRMAGAVERFTEDRDVLLRYHDLPSAARRNRLRTFYRAWRERLEDLPFEEYGVEGRIDWVLLRNHVEYELRSLDHRGELHEEILPLLPFDSLIVDLHLSRRAVEAVEPRDAARTVRRAVERLERVRSEAAEALGEDRRPESGGPLAGEASTDLPLDAVRTLRAADRLSELREALDDWFAFHDGFDPQFGWWVRAPYRELTDALDEYEVLLREEGAGIRPDEPGPIVGDPIGREALLTELEHEMITYTPEELMELARRELARGEERMREAARELGFGDDWRAALEHVKGLHVEAGEQPLLARDLAAEAERYVEEHDLVTVPPLAREVWRMEMLSPERQREAPFFLGGEVLRVAFPTEEMEHEDKLMSLRANNVHFSRAVVHHELIPGHHLQGFMTRRFSKHRSVFSTPFWGEGWALYWELLLWDRDFPRSPEDEIGMLFWRNHRAARILFSLGFHLGEMTPEEAVDFLVERVGHERSAAEAEVRRSFAGSYPPLYQAGYLLGGLQFRELHRELVESGPWTDREFHDRILRSGRMPVEMVRASLREEPPARDFEASWRFADGNR